MYKKTLICASILHEDGEKVIKSALEAVSQGVDLIEIRLDALSDPYPEMVKAILQEINHPLIVTNRMKDEGGFFEGSERERTDILLSAAEFAEYVDIELQTRDKYKYKIIKASKSTIVSYHNFEETPSIGELLKIVGRAKEVGDLAKFAVMPRDIQDTLKVLEVVSQADNTIGISMGKLGSYTRVIAPLFGSPITYASLDAQSAPGQLAIKTTQNILNELKD
ncbi:MAG: type I 3-dehydroquinate dehydratase [Methanobacteriaceae archaeon]|nr:type I 3-dehydroquinate dehydratase [Methanobacteriaceae archaeon]